MSTLEECKGKFCYCSGGYTGDGRGIFEDLLDGLKSGKYVIGCPLPAGFKPMAREDRVNLQKVMMRIVEMEQSEK